MSRIGIIQCVCVWIIAPVLLAACAPKVPPPEKTIEALYAPYVSHVAENGESSWEKAGVYSKKFKAAIDRGLEYSFLLNVPVIDYDPIVGTKDFSITNLQVEVDRPVSAGKAHVIARFENVNRETTVGYDMILENGSWKVDGIRNGNRDFRQSIVNALKTIGDPEAMKEPVEAIYAKYREAPTIEPLYLWAPLTNDLRDKLETAASMSVVLNIDPVCNGAAGVPSDVKLEAVSGGVIARFHVNHQERLVVFDVVDNLGVWTIDDIHSPGRPAWDLVQKLEDAGIH